MGYWDTEIGEQPYSAIPSIAAFQGGGSGATGLLFKPSGNGFTFVSAGQAPGIINQDNVVAAFKVPASFFDQAGRGLEITASGSFANNTNSKRAKVIVNPASAVVGSQVGSGGTTIADTGAYSTTGAVGWQLLCNIFKYGAKGSNTQMGIHQGAQMGSTLGSLLVPSPLALVESASILIAFTLDCVTATADGALNLAEIFAMN